MTVLTVRYCLIVVAPLLVACANPASADRAAERVQRAGFDQRLGESVPGAARFVDDHGRAVQLADYFGSERPVALVFAYYRCPHLCSSVLAGVFQGLSRTGYRAGEEYELVVIGIDPRETTAEAASKKADLLARTGIQVAAAHTHFLVGERSAIESVTAAAGFRHYHDAEYDQYVHAAGLLLLTPEGVISRYLFGVRYPADDLRLAMVEASDSRVGSVADRLLLLCSHYDPESGTYGVVIMKVLRLAGGASVLLLGGFVLLSALRDRRRAQSAGGGS